MGTASDEIDPADRELVDRFLAAFNEIDNHLRHELREGPDRAFISMLNDYGANNPVWNARDGRRMRPYAALRNALVHTQNHTDVYLAIPVERIVDDIERIANDLIRPEKVIPKFQRDVASLEFGASLVTALELIKQDSYSQFPVYDTSNAFKGLLTENGITRWLAAHVSNVDELISFTETTVEIVLGAEERRGNFTFVSRSASVTSVVSQFGQSALLEAVLITHTGKRTEKLLGIVTRWDIQDYLR